MAVKNTTDKIYNAYFCGVTSVANYITDILYNKKYDDVEKVSMLTKKIDRFYDAMNTYYLNKEDKISLENIRNAEE